MQQRRISGDSRGIRMSILSQNERRLLVDLLPRFLTGATRGWGGLAPLLESTGLDRPAFFPLRAFVQEQDAGDGMTRAEMQTDLFNPYSTIRSALDALPALVEKGYVRREGERYIVSQEGREVTAHIETARNAYLASLAPIPAADLTRLVERLTAIARGLRDAPEPTIKAHQARAWRGMPPMHAAPMVRLYGAVYALWTARDDSHNAAWRAAGFDGPTFDLLSRIWSDSALTIGALTEIVRQFQRPEDVARGVEALVTARFLARDDALLRLTPEGNVIRNHIEAETDRISFAPWPPLARQEFAWLQMTLEAVVAGVPS